MRKFRYVLVDGADGGSWHLYGDPDRPSQRQYATEELCALPRLLAEGWVPVRETALAETRGGLFRGEARSICLVLLSKDE